jgi:transposase-like protein
VHGQRAAIAAAFAQESARAAHEQSCVLADRFRSSIPELAKLMDGGEHEVLPHRGIPRMHGLQTRSTNPLGRLSAKIERRTYGISPNDSAITRGSARCAWSRTTNGVRTAAS